VWVHGGSFCCGSKTSPELVEEANAFARKGYVNVSIDYRLVPNGCAPGADLGRCITAIGQAREDAQTAVRFLRSQAANFRIDPDRIAIGGTSAGAITALNVGYSPENPGSGQHQGFSSAVRTTSSPAPLPRGHGTRACSTVRRRRRWWCGRRSGFRRRSQCGSRA